MTFAKTLNSITNKHHTSKVFDDFLQMAVCAYSLGKSEDLYLERAKSYNEQELKGFGQALGALILEHEKTNGNEWKDHLGSYFEEYGQFNARMGQFFTPVSICNLMAFIVDDKEQDQTVNDPSCGSSRNLIAHANKNPMNRLKYTYIGQDLDKRCCLMSVLNFVMFGMKGVIINMNCLSMEVYGGWRIFLPETGLGVKPLSVKECNRYLFEYKEKEEKVKQIEQLKLF